MCRNPEVMCIFEAFGIVSSTSTSFQLLEKALLISIMIPGCILHHSTDPQALVQNWAELQSRLVTRAKIFWALINKWQIMETHSWFLNFVFSTLCCSCDVFAKILIQEWLLPLHFSRSVLPQSRGFVHVTLKDNQLCVRISQIIFAILLLILMHLQKKVQKIFLEMKLWNYELSVHAFFPSLERQESVATTEARLRMEGVELKEEWQDEDFPRYFHSYTLHCLVIIFYHIACVLKVYEPYTYWRKYIHLNKH